MTEPDETRRVLLNALAGSCPGEVVTGFAIVVECAGQNGARSLMTFSSDAAGDADLPTWTAHGLLNYALSEGLFEAVLVEDDDDADSD